MTKQNCASIIKLLQIFYSYQINLGIIFLLQFINGRKMVVNT
jgi:hypothetical protein